MIPTILNDRYRVIELVGAGGMATVHRGEDLLLERQIAVKFLRDPYASDAEARDRFLHEARSAAKLDHPNIVRIYDVGTDKANRPFIVMELVRGEDLKSLVRREAPLPVMRALAIARDISAGVGQAHRMGIVHCDLKPQNILLTEEGQVKVADFGIARALQQDENDDEVLDVVWGSPHYISPEQARGRRPSPASDIYSIGIMLYEMLTGVPPFHDPDPGVLAMKHCREEPAPLPSLNPRVPPGLDWLVRKILAKEPTQRYRNGDQLGMALDEYLQRGVEGTRPYPPIVEETPVVPNRRPVSSSDAPSAWHGSEATPHDGDRIVVPTDRIVAPTVQAAVPQGNPVRSPDARSSVKLEDAPAGNDMTLWMLILIAAIAVIGLIPLWLFVYRAYNPPVVAAVPSTIENIPTVPASEAEEMVTVPNLTSLSAADAQRLAQSLGLEIEVLGEEESSDARPGAVLRQTPGVGNRVAVDTTVSIVLAAGRAFLLPDVVGYDLGTVRDGLESEGLLLIINEVRSGEGRGVILEQQPAAEEEVRVGDTITLTVSGGGDVPIVFGTNLNNQTVLEQAWVSRVSFRPGDTVPVTLRWRCTARFERNYKVFVHVLRQETGALAAQADVIPGSGLRPTTSWAPGEIINDPHQIVLPPDTRAGTYVIRVGLYDDGGRLPVVDAGSAQVLDNTIFVATITVE
jgi:eukaryotic-like serine/threonine-protein kinase